MLRPACETCRSGWSSCTDARGGLLSRAFAALAALLFAIAPLASAAQPPRDPSQEATPCPRWGHVFVYDPARRTTLLFGGSRERGSYLDDTWSWDGRSWQQHTAPGPGARGFAAAGFHAGRGTIIVHGGRGEDEITYSDTWEWASGREEAH